MFHFRTWKIDHKYVKKKDRSCFPTTALPKVNYHQGGLQAFFSEQRCIFRFVQISDAERMALHFNSIGNCSLHPEHGCLEGGRDISLLSFPLQVVELTIFQVLKVFFTMNRFNLDKFLDNCTFPIDAVVHCRERKQ